MANQIQILPSGTYTTTRTFQGLINDRSRGVDVIVNVTAIPSGSLTVHIQAFDPGSRTYYDLLVSTAITTTGMNVFRVDPILLPVPNLIAQAIVPQVWGVQIVAADNSAITYSVGANLVDP